MQRRRARSSGACGHEELGLGIRADHGADVAPVEHGAAGLCREAPLQIEERVAHRLEGGDDRGGIPHLASAQALVLEALEVELTRDDRRGLDLGEGAAVVEERAGDRSVEKPGVEMRQAVMRGKPFRERSLPGRRRSVDGDDHLGGPDPGPKRPHQRHEGREARLDHGAVVDRHAVRGRRGP